MLLTYALVLFTLCSNPALHTRALLEPFTTLSISFPITEAPNYYRQLQRLYFSPPSSTAPNCCASSLLLALAVTTRYLLCSLRSCGLSYHLRRTRHFSTIVTIIYYLFRLSQMIVLSLFPGQYFVTHAIRVYWQLYFLSQLAHSQLNLLQLVHCAGILTSLL